MLRRTLRAYALSNPKIGWWVGDTKLVMGEGGVKFSSIFFWCLVACYDKLPMFDLTLGNLINSVQ